LTATRCVIGIAVGNLIVFEYTVFALTVDVTVVKGDARVNEYELNVVPVAPVEPTHPVGCHPVYPVIPVRPVGP